MASPHFIPHTYCYPYCTILPAEATTKNTKIVNYLNFFILFLAKDFFYVIVKLTDQFYKGGYPMSEKIQWIMNTMTASADKHLALLKQEEVQQVRAFHAGFPQYEPTPLVNLPRMAGHLGIRELCIKDESWRFGLNAFKVLGGSYAMSRYIAEELGHPEEPLPYAELTSPELHQKFGQAVFFSATDGNHGRGVAWSARQLGQKAVIFMPKGTTNARLKNIQAEAAEVTIEDMNYDACVRLAAEEAAKVPHGVVIQDTAWKGYEKIPSWIMQGYSTMVDEAVEACSAPPTHVFVQAGVGSLAGAVTGYLANRFSPAPPRIIVVEAEAAACLYRSAAAGDGQPRIVEGDMETIMAGLACGEPNITAWDILRNHADCFLTLDDTTCARGMRMLAAPLKGDAPVTSGESGASTFAALAAILQKEENMALRKALQLDGNSRVLLFSTEGNTDPERYERIVWDGRGK